MISALTFSDPNFSFDELEPTKHFLKLFKDCIARYFVPLRDVNMTVFQDGKYIILEDSTVGYLGSSPDPGCQFPASTSPKNTGESSKIILFDEYDESEWRSLITKDDNFLLNKNMNFRTFPLTIRCPAHQITY